MQEVGRRSDIMISEPDRDSGRVLPNTSKYN